jgi:hypothetical protein
MAKFHSIGNDRALHLLMLAHLAQSQEGEWRKAIDDLVEALEYIVEETSDPERVIFRKFPHTGEVIALFPDRYNERNGNIGSYMHNGQHADTAPDFGDTKAAEPHEYRLLQQELETSYGYRLRPVKRFGKLGRK